MTTHYRPVRPSATVRGALGGTLSLDTPWARDAIPDADRQGIADRVPAGYSLTLGAAGSSSRKSWTVRLYSGDHRLDLYGQRDARQALETALERLG